MDDYELVKIPVTAELTPRVTPESADVDVWADNWLDKAAARVADRLLQRSAAPAYQRIHWTPGPFPSLSDEANNYGPGERVYDPKGDVPSTFRDMRTRRKDFIRPFDSEELDGSALEGDNADYFDSVGITEEQLAESGFGANAPGEKVREHPEGMEQQGPKGRTSIGRRNIEAVLAMATPEEIDYWRHWYKMAHREAVRLAVKHKVPILKAAATIAVLSPQEDWMNNLALADAALGQDWHNVSTLVGSRQKAYSIVVNDDYSAIRGPKVFPFFLSIYDPQKFQEEVVVDTHAAAIWLGLRQSSVPGISDSTRAKMVRDYAAAGAQFGLSAQEAQAVSWVLWRQIPVTRGPAKSAAVAGNAAGSSLEGVEPGTQFKAGGVIWEVEGVAPSESGEHLRLFAFTPRYISIAHRPRSQLENNPNPSFRTLNRLDEFQFAGRKWTVDHTKWDGNDYMLVAYDI